MKICIDEVSCSGCGICESMLPHVFEIQEDMICHVIGDVSEEDNIGVVVESCSSGAISVED